MISGDQSACAEAAALFPGIVTAVVKEAKGRDAADCLPPAATAELIEQCAAKGVEHLLSDTPPRPLRLAAPVTVTMEFVKSQMADAASIMPGACRVDGKTRRVRRPRHARSLPGVPVAGGPGVSVGVSTGATHRCASSTWPR